MRGTVRLRSCEALGLDLEVAVVRRTREDLPGEVFAVLLGVEHPPAARERRGDLRSQDSALGGIAVGDVPAGDFVVAFILKTRQPGESGVDRGGWVTALSQDAPRLQALRIVLADVEDVG